MNTHLTRELGDTAHVSDTVEAFLERIVSAWNAGDANAYAEEFTKHATYVVFMGLLLRGRASIRAEHVPVFSTYQRGSRMTIRVLDVRMPAPDVALVVTTGGIGTGRRVPEDKVQTFTLVLDEGRWRCAAFQNTKRQRVLLRMHALFNRRAAAAASGGTAGTAAA
jgi:uncharacterized protein (TIGR02246 family)